MERSDLAQFAPATIDACQALLRSLHCSLDKEHGESHDGGMLWTVTCTKGGNQFMAGGGSPLEAWQRAVEQAMKLT